jgi:hypothetical protein
MKTIKLWLSFFETEHPIGHKLLTSLYLFAPLVLCVLGFIDGLPAISLKSLSIVGAIVVGLILLGLSHLSVAGTLYSYDRGEPETATTIVCYGGLILLGITLMLPH